MIKKNLQDINFGIVQQKGILVKNMVSF